MRRSLIWCAVALMFGSGAALPELAAQLPAARVLRDLGDGSWIVLIGTRDTMHAISMAEMKGMLEMEVELDATRDSLRVLKRTAEEYAAYRQAAERHKTASDSLHGVKDQQLADLRARGDLLERLRKEAFLISEVGAGYSGNGLGAIVGLGTRRFRVWGVLQEEGSGIFGGYFIPIW